MRIFMLYFVEYRYIYVELEQALTKATELPFQRRLFEFKSSIIPQLHLLAVSFNRSFDCKCKFCGLWLVRQFTLEIS